MLHNETNQFAQQKQIWAIYITTRNKVPESAKAAKARLTVLGILANNHMKSSEHY